MKNSVVDALCDEVNCLVFKAFTRVIGKRDRLRREMNNGVTRASLPVPAHVSWEQADCDEGPGDAHTAGGGFLVSRRSM